MFIKNSFSFENLRLKKGLIEIKINGYEKLRITAFLWLNFAKLEHYYSIKLLFNNVKFNLRCLNCDEDFIGKTTRVCSKRKEEHEHSDLKSDVYQHHHTAGHKNNFDNVKI